MKIKMLSTRDYAEGGHTLRTCIEGTIVEVPDEIGRAFLSEKWAEPAKDAPAVKTAAKPSSTVDAGWSGEPGAHKPKKVDR